MPVYTEASYQKGIGSLTVNSTVIEGLIEAGYPEVATAYNEVKHNGLVDGKVHKLKGWRTPGQLTFKCIYTAAMMTALQALADTDTIYPCIRTLPDSEAKNFSAYVGDPIVETDPDLKENTIECTLELSGGSQGVV